MLAFQSTYFDIVAKTQGSCSSNKKICLKEQNVMYLKIAKKKKKKRAYQINERK